MSTATARRIYNAVKDVPASVTAIREEYAALALSLATDADATFDLTSSTVNNQTFSGKRSMSSEDRFALLSQVVWMLDNEAPIPSSTRIAF